MIQSTLIFFIRIYQSSLSLLLGQRCRFYPSCSEYTLEAIKTHGSASGLVLSAKRICKCHPFHPGGVDLVPVKDDAVLPKAQKV